MMNGYDRYRRRRRLGIGPYEYLLRRYMITYRKRPTHQRFWFLVLLLKILLYVPFIIIVRYMHVTVRVYLLYITGIVYTCVVECLME